MSNVTLDDFVNISEVPDRTTFKMDAELPMLKSEFNAQYEAQLANNDITDIGEAYVLEEDVYYVIGYVQSGVGHLSEKWYNAVLGLEK